MGDSSRPIKIVHGHNKVYIHISIQKKLYDCLYIYREELIGQPSISGIIESAVRQLLDDAGYLGDA